MLIITGGYYDAEFGSNTLRELDTTMVMPYNGDSGWREAGKLPSTRREFSGAMMGGVFYVVGGGGVPTGEICSWNPDTEEWTVEGHMLERSDGDSGRRMHAITGASLAALAEYCT